MPALSKPKVFVVDDEQIIALTLAAILNQSGFFATSFTNAIQALNSASESCPDFLISDVMMPDLNGIDLAVQVKSACSTCKIVLFSGQAQTSDLLATAREQGHDFTLLTKPVHPTELLAAMGTLKP